MKKNNKKNRVKVKDFGKPMDKVGVLDKDNLMPLPAPYDNPENIPDFAEYNSKFDENLELRRVSSAYPDQGGSDKTV